MIEFVMKRREEMVRSELAWHREVITKACINDEVVTGFSDFCGAYRKVEEVDWVDFVVDHAKEVWEYL